MQYLVITNRGYWGKAKTAIEAARNAMVGGSYVEGCLIRIPEEIAVKVGCTGMGGWTYTFTDELMEVCPDNGKNQWLLDAISEMAVIERCGFVITKKQLRVTLIED